eukprot:CAMPEP_0179311822 /NCGR_PEP_ID=MMETSP0797-20121207/52900_1 /TAXON_ID=47934 /ORGANISM="Dinophysis acuminata, Strain DAEP01" /LENGTH=303 /DNA_ID=CAMNT_0021021639 /DNA_START=127 /DNA_END=1034 /DNA_ORIENTATION=-
MPLYEEKLINPLAVRFSQDRIWPDFQDGTRIEDSLTQIASVSLKTANYDMVMRPPFPPMEVIRLKQERRESDGERVRDEKGRRLYGEESWYTFDNRRLYCLQRAALQLWPMVAAVVVKVLFDFPAVRCARHKFRTTSDGCSVKISLPDGQPGSLWNWEEAAETLHASKAATSSVMDAVANDKNKNRKELLVDVPPLALLSPGTRETTVAERFNLGTFRGGDNNDGKVAGKQLLSLLQGGGGGSEGGGGGSAMLASLFGAPQADGANAAAEAEDYGGWDQHGAEHHNRGKSRGKGGGRAGRRGG